MKIRIVQGKFYKNFIHFYDIKTARDVEILGHVKNIVTRSEYLPYIKALNKNITESLFLPNNLVPAQFIQDIRNSLLPVYPDLKFENLNLLFDNTFSDEFFDEWLSNIKLPEGFSVDTPEYIYQKHSVRNLLIARTGRIQIGTGGGKTMITYLCCKYLLDNVLRKIPKDQPRKILIVIDRKDLIIQTKREFEKFDAPNQIINGNDYCVPMMVESIYSGSKRVENANIVIATWQSIKDYESDWFMDFKCFILDEAHKGKAYNIRNVIYNQLRNIEYCWGFTATWPQYKSLEYLSVVGMFGPLVYKKTTRQLIDDGNVCDVMVVRIHIKYNEFETNFRNRLNENYKDELRGNELYLMEKAWFHEHHERTMVCMTLIQQLPNNHLLLVDTVAYIDILVKYVQEHCPDRTIFIIYNEIDTETREASKKRMNEENGIVMIATKATMSTGVSINNIYYGHNLDGGKSEYSTPQGLGRILRKHDGKTKAYFFDYIDHVSNSSFIKHANERLKLFKRDQIDISDIYKTVKPNEYGFES